MSVLATLAHAALFTVFLWWFTTGAILYLDGLPRRTFRWSMVAVTVALFAALQILWETRNDTSVWGAYIAFGCAIIAWGWNEMAFLMGYVTGPRNTPCPPGATGFDRLRFATETVIWHEIAIAVTALAIFVVTADGANRVGFNAFAILWVLRLSAKINVFLGVRNLSEEFLPKHLRYLESYFCRRDTLNPVFPLSVTATTVLATMLAMQMLDPKATAFDATASALLMTLTVLALLEHWLMVLPVSATVLWKWGLASHNQPEPISDPGPPGTLPTVVAFPQQTLHSASTTVPRRRP
ncbi:MAG: putative photosynthetic complex assembly protein PuhE [Hyphomicrobium aestuarii]|nr:putative photosynthetic complex assembly protein PuhE [Hyphomicrobium aestuarii]